MQYISAVEIGESCTPSALAERVFRHGGSAEHKLGPRVRSHGRSTRKSSKLAWKSKDQDITLSLGQFHIPLQAHQNPRVVLSTICVAVSR